MLIAAGKKKLVKCPICGCNDHIEGEDCFNCRYFLNLKTDFEAGEILIHNGNAYRMENGVSKMIIKKTSGEILYITKLWDVGTIPDNFLHHFPDNTTLIKKLVYRQSNGKTTAPIHSCFGEGTRT